MKKIVFILLLLPMVFIGQTTTKSYLYEVTNLKVKPGEEKAFETAVKKHNAKYYKKESPNPAALFYNINGPNGGSYSWIMRLSSFADLDNITSSKAQKESWKNILQYVQEKSVPNYWNGEADMSFPGAKKGGDKSELVFYNVKYGKFQKFKTLVAQVVKMYESQRPDESFYAYTNSFFNTKGYNVAAVFPFNKWAELDKQSKFKQDYEAVFGKGSVEIFRNEFVSCVKDQYSAIRRRID